MCILSFDNVTYFEGNTPISNTEDTWRIAFKI